MPASIYRSSEGQAEILRLYDEALSHLRIGHKSKSVSTRYGETHVLSLGPEDAPLVVFLHGGNFLSPTCLRWFLPIAQRYHIYAPDIVGQPGKLRRRSAQGARCGELAVPGASTLYLLVMFSVRILMVFKRPSHTPGTNYQDKS